MTKSKRWDDVTTAESISKHINTFLSEVGLEYKYQMYVSSIHNLTLLCDYDFDKNLGITTDIKIKYKNIEMLVGTHNSNTLMIHNHYLYSVMVRHERRYLFDSIKKSVDFWNLRVLKLLLMDEISEKI